MQNKTPTAVTYSLAAAASSGLFMNPNRQMEGSWLEILLFWMLTCAVPLMFVFAYPRYLFGASSPLKRPKYAAILHVLGAITATVLFPILALPFWENRWGNDNAILILMLGLTALAVFLVAGLFLLLRGKSSLALLASLLFWPYWLALAVVTMPWFLEVPPRQALLYFPYFIIPIPFAFAAGALSYRPALSNGLALAGLMGAPWLYWSVIRGTALGNIWIEFNADDKLVGYNAELYAALAILAVGLVAAAIATAALRLLPSRLRFRELPLRDRTWPAVAASVLFIALWFTQSVMPYRMPGALDYADWTVLQILHVEKRGLQFHETCVSIRGHHDVFSLSFSRNDRRLFQYRFQENYASGQLPESLTQRVRTMAADRKSQNWDTVKPLRAWNVDGWYFRAPGTLKAYTSDNGSTPPQEIVDLFRDLEKIPLSPETRSEQRRDVCFGFCYDPLSGLGFLYANHRCGYNGHEYVCR